ncbi:MAG: hypothetical protein Q9188_002737 [Gyalolechia gomerana]
MDQKANNKDYQTLKVLGKGSFGVVKKVERLNDLRLLACKVIHFPEGELKSTDGEREYAILSRLDHPHIVKYVDYCWKPDKAKLYMEYCAGGDISYLIKQAERDIKPANIMIYDTDGDMIKVKLGDFGLSRIIDDGKLPATYVGTKQYQPPEIARANSSGINWTKKCDIFSLGCTLYAMCTWEAPFSWRMEESGEFDAIPVTYSERLRKCIASCLSFRSEERPDAFDLLRLVQRARNDPDTRDLVPPMHRFPERRHASWALGLHLKKAPIQARDGQSPKLQPYTSSLFGGHKESAIKGPIQERIQPKHTGFQEPTSNSFGFFAAAKQHYSRTIRCPLCTRDFSGDTTAEASAKVQKHFKTEHRKEHGIHRCGIAGCQYSRGSGFYCSHVLLRHYETDHPGRPPPSPEPPIFCSLPDCLWGIGTFEGFATEAAENMHHSRFHKGKEIISQLTLELASQSDFFCPFPGCDYLKEEPNSLFSSRFQAVNQLRDHINRDHFRLSKRSDSLWDISGWFVWPTSSKPLQPFEPAQDRKGGLFGNPAIDTSRQKSGIFSGFGSEPESPNHEKPKLKFKGFGENV